MSVVLAVLVLTQLPFSISGLLPRDQVSMQQESNRTHAGETDVKKPKPQPPSLPARPDPFAPLPGDTQQNPSDTAGQTTEDLPRMAVALTTETLVPPTLPPMPVSISKPVALGPALQGIAKCGSETVALFRQSDGCIVYMRTGEKIPPGQWIVKGITEDSVVLEATRGSRRDRLVLAVGKRLPSERSGSS